MKYIFNARQKEVPEQPRGMEIKSAENVPQGHLLVRMGPNGRNAIVGDAERIQAGDALISIPDYEQG
jgi:hypothetical protein